MAVRDRAQAVLEALGPDAAGRVLGVARHTLVGLLAGMPVRRGTLAIVELRLGVAEAAAAALRGAA